MEDTPRLDSQPNRIDWKSALPGEIAHEAIFNRRADQTFCELAAFLELLQSLNCNTVVEIGTGSCGTAWAFLAVADRVFSIDKQKPSPFPNYGANLVYIAGDSHAPGTYDDMKKRTTPFGVDCLFIDGDHRYDGVKRDHETYGPLVRDGGIVAFHDIAGRTGLGPEVKRYWEEVKASGVSWSEIIDSGSRHGIGYYIKQ